MSTRAAVAGVYRLVTSRENISAAAWRHVSISTREKWRDGAWPSIANGWHLARRGILANIYSSHVASEESVSARANWACGGSAARNGMALRHS